MHVFSVLLTFRSFVGNFVEAIHFEKKPSNSSRFSTKHFRREAPGERK